MGRELKRKEAKRTGKNVKEAQKKNKDKPMSTKAFLATIITIVILFLITYLLVGIFVTKDIKWFSKSNKKETTEKTNSISNRILASDSLKQDDEIYYVYYYDTTNEDSEIKSAVNSLEETLYRVDLHDDFNANFVGEPSGIVDSIEKLKVSDPTVIKVSSKKIVAFYSGDEIKNSLK